MVCINEEVGVDEAGWRVLQDGMGYCIVEARVHGPRCRPAGSLVRGWWQRRCLGLFECRVQRRFAIADRVRMSRDDIGDLRKM